MRHIYLQSIFKITVQSKKCLNFNKKIMQVRQHWNKKTQRKVPVHYLFKKTKYILVQHYKTYIQCNLLFSVILQQICFPAGIFLADIKVIHRHQMMSVSVQPKYADEILQGVKQLNCRSIAKTTLCYHLWILASNFCLNSLLPPQVPRLGQVLNKTITTTIILMAISHVDQPSTSLPLSSTCQVPHYPSLSNCSNKGIFIVDNVRWLSCHQTNSAVNPLKPMKTTDRCNSCFFQQCQRTEGNSKHDHNQEKSPSGSHPSWTINWLQTKKICTLYTTLYTLYCYL